MEKCAVILNGNDVVKVSNLKRKYNKIINNPDIKILTECSEDKLEECYIYWKQITKKEETEEEIKKYFYKNDRGETIISIYPTLEKLKNVIKDYESFVRQN
jgi:6-pyruvoyl-tetrahydropterin synthase